MFRYPDRHLGQAPRGSTALRSLITVTVSSISITSAKEALSSGHSGPECPSYGTRRKLRRGHHRKGWNLGRKPRQASSLLLQPISSRLVIIRTRYTGTLHIALMLYVLPFPPPRFYYIKMQTELCRSELSYARAPEVTSGRAQTRGWYGTYKYQANVN